VLPWQDVAVDLIGPWTISVGGQKQWCHALTIIDKVTNLVEVVRVNNTTTATSAFILKTLGLLGSLNPCIASMKMGVSSCWAMIFSSCWPVMAFRQGPLVRKKTHKLIQFVVKECTNQFGIHCGF
jgi:hypothetical protein